MAAYVPANVPLPQRLALTGKASGAGGTLHAVLDLDSDLGNVAGSAMVSNWPGGIPKKMEADIQVAALDVEAILGIHGQVFFDLARKAGVGSYVVKHGVFGQFDEKREGVRRSL